MIVVINGVRFVILNIKCLILIIDWKFLSIMDNVIVMIKKMKIVIVY